MTPQDIEALERALAKLPADLRAMRFDQLPEWHAYQAACDPDRIRRLLDALKEAEKRQGQLAEVGLMLNSTTEAKLATAIEALEDIAEGPARWTAEGMAWVAREVLKEVAP